MAGIQAVLRRAISYEKNILDILSPRVAGRQALSIGSGDGLIESRLQEILGIKITGAEVTEYPNPRIRTEMYDGRRLPFKARQFDCSFFIYSLHHTDDIEGLLREAMRVTRGPILILDHTYSGPLGRGILKSFDWFSNLDWKMPLPYNFLTIREWAGLFSRLGLEITEARPGPFTVFFQVDSRR